MVEGKIVKMKVSLKNRRTNSMVYKNKVKSMTEGHQKYLGNRNDQKKKKKERKKSQGDNEEADSLNLQYDMTANES